MALLLDARNYDEVADLIESHTIIVGGGTIGLFLAISLARGNIPIVVLECGGHVANTDRTGQTAASVGKRHAGVTLGRAFGLGGTSSLWGGQLAEFEGPDLKAPGREWPLAYSELKQLYDSTYDFFGIMPRGDDKYRWSFGKEEAHDLFVERFFTHWLRQPNFAALFQSEILTNPILKIVLNSTVHDIEFESCEAKSVFATACGRRNIKVSGRNFIFACGTIENSRFFLTSQRQANVPWRENKNIGTYFQDHLGGKVASVRVLNEYKLREFFENGVISGLKVQPKLRFTHEGRRNESVGVCGFFSFESELSGSIQNIKALVRAFRSGLTFSSFSTLPSDVKAMGLALFPLVVRYARDRRILAFFDRGLDFSVQAEQFPVAESQIRLSDDERLEDGLFRAVVDWKVDGREIESIRSFTSRVDTYLQREGIARLLVDERVENKDMSIIERFGDTYHQCGGMCMSSSPALGVVDPDCRVWNTTNVFVAGPSVFPTSSHSNCTLTALALATRLASKIKGA